MKLICVRIPEKVALRFSKTVLDSFFFFHVMASLVQMERELILERPSTDCCFMLNTAPGFPNSAICAWNNGLIASVPRSGPSDVNRTAPGA